MLCEANSEIEAERGLRTMQYKFNTAPEFQVVEEFLCPEEFGRLFNKKDSR